MSHPVGCRCGVVRGVLGDSRDAIRVVCYCKDCQAFAHFLGSWEQVLDERGGSDIVQVLPKSLTFTQGVQSLACMRLTPKGLLRWYASCCRTPIGNTLATPKLSFVGLLHSCLEVGNHSVSGSFGPITAWVNTKGARGNPKPEAKGQSRTIRRFIQRTLKARINGDYKLTPFFQPDTHAPIAVPQVLTDDELARVLDAVRVASH